MPALDTIVPIAETFIAPQGEGTFTGTLMLFIRLAGCTVGRHWTEAGLNREKDRQGSNALFTIPENHEQCTLFDGRTFCCDTDYKVHSKLSITALAALIKTSGVLHVCITGGEPLIHAAALSQLLEATDDLDVMFHIETSGTISLVDDIAQCFISDLFARGGWVATSPKLGYLDEEYSDIADEAKILVDEYLDFDKLPRELLRNGEQERLKVFLQPVNEVNVVSQINVARCLALQLQHPWLRLSTQAHKLWGTR